MMTDVKVTINLILKLLFVPRYFEALACNVIAEMNLRDREGSQKLLVQPDKDNQTVMKISVNNGLMKFMGTTACQTKLNRIWKEKMSIFTSKEMV